MRLVHNGILLGLCVSLATVGCIRARVRTPERLVPEKIQIGSGDGSWSTSPGGNGSRFVMIGYDSLARIGRSVALSAHLVDTVSDEPVEGISVGFYRGRELLGVSRTDSDGLAQVAWTPPRTGDFRIDVRVVETPPGADERLADLPDTPMLISCLDSQSAICLVDTDRTFFDGPFRKALGGKRPDRDVSEALQAVDRRYTLVYLVESPGALAGQGRQWLARHSLPEGVLLLKSPQASWDDKGRFKTGSAEAVKSEFANTAVGIAGSSEQANRMLARNLRTILVVHYEDDEEDEVQDAIRSIRDVRDSRRFEAVDDWKSVQRALTAGEEFPPEKLLRDLERRLSRIRDDD
jgi:hypothetical protein